MQNQQTQSQTQQTQKEPYKLKEQSRFGGNSHINTHRRSKQTCGIPVLVMLRKRGNTKTLVSGFRKSRPVNIEITDQWGVGKKQNANTRLVFPGIRVITEEAALSRLANLPHAKLPRDPKVDMTKT